MPYYIINLLEFGLDPSTLLNPPPSRVDIERRHFCAFMYSNCDNKFDGVVKRNMFYNKLKNALGEDAVRSLGKCEKNTKYFRGDRQKYSTNSDIFKDYQFVIAFENTTTPGYITEKFIYPIMAGCIPIYWGAPDIVDHFNPDRFINVQDFENIEMCIKYITSLHKNINKIMSIINKPVFKNDKLNHHFSFLTGNHPEFNKSIESLNIYHMPFTRYKKLKRKENIELIKGGTSPVKVIHLNISIHKNREIKLRQSFKELELKFDFFNAVLGKKYIDDFKKVNKKPLISGELGCYLSHMEVALQLLEDPKNSYYIIFEDDVIIDKKFKNYQSIIANAPKDWDIILLGVNFRGCPSYVGTKSYKKLISNICMPGTYAYIINKRSASYIVNFGIPIYEPFDVFIQNIDLNKYIYDIVNVSYVETSSTGNSSVLQIFN